MTKRKCFLSFYYKTDNWRVAQVKNIGSIEEQPILSSNDWEQIEKNGDAAIEKWIEDNMKGKSCLVVLVGSQTSGRRWVKYEVKRACDKGMGDLGVYIHNLKDRAGKQTSKGASPFEGVMVNGKSIASYAKMYDPPSTDSKTVYEYISDNIASWIDNAIRLRA